MKKAKNWKKSSIIGALVMAGLILVSLPLGVGHSLNDLRGDAQSEFYGDKTGYSIWDGLEARREAANNLLTVAKKYTGEHTELIPYVNALEHQVQASEWAYDETFATEAAVNFELGARAKYLAEALEGIELEERDRKYPARLLAQMESEQDMIERSGYNDAAREFNRRLKVFPVNVLYRFTDVERLEPFDETPEMADELDFIEAEYYGEDEVTENIVEQYFSEEDVASRIAAEEDS